MIDNPFISKVYVDIWLDHFGKTQKSTKIEGINHLDFFKSRFGVLINSGSTHTKGIYYSLDENIDLKNKTCLINDVPSYFECTKNNHSKNIEIKKIKQYPGFLIELDQFTSLEEYMQQTFKKSSRYKLNKYKKRLEQCFEIKSTMYTGNISEEKYQGIFQKFRELLEKRFEDKQEYNNNLDKQEWEFYKKVSYPLFKENKAGFFVVEYNQEPIAITLNYFSNKIIFDAITVFDIDYTKFHLGSINIMYLIKWGIENNFKILDFSKGYFDYKVRWCTKKYDFEYHIIYNPKSITSASKAGILSWFYTKKQQLRENGVNKKWGALRYTIKNLSTHKTQTTDVAINPVFTDYDIKTELLSNKIITYNENLKKVFFDFLYLFGETASDVVVFKIENGQQYVFKGKNHCKVSIIN
ncbi:GNAT family N-acetyltransferase [Flagellimonas zhangzhouensis]|uniref:Acetyltransferase (GNAT) domain-containing protein n=1 Tax=Flagellimonas zhangzhouensis TaxID=1073328 RepID=A0A1H2RNS0_9FLAO|nr:GNAT family N-acetyltransferase [Allomuricauda zhangzhouensis]SDQ66098.1 Acetyltransferase (GNAT) domain-containing protein [Allomuricauda zhangzhouensis]SDW21106.1 Acetyltransferase (GNAT) domain-containing protein [Allomuricauda zhangzhouensis]